nr:FxLYD domain-containing protein [Metabacillus kandeliae]
MYKGKAKASGGELAGKSTPLSFSSIKAKANEYGDINISGTMVNKTKKTMRLLTIYLKFYDEEGNFLKNEIVYADQIQIKSGAKGSFKTVIYGLNTEGMYKVDQVTWNEV